MHTDPLISTFVMSILAILILSIIMKRLKQPYLLVYILAGIILGPNVLGIISDQVTLTRLGAFGVVFLLFFVGMEVSPQRLVENWLISFVGTLLQVFISVLVVAMIGIYLQWTLARIILLGFVISLSSTAVVLKLLDDWKELNTRVGQDVVGILLVQDLIIVPMLIILGLLSGTGANLKTLGLQAIGGSIVLSIAIWLLIKKEVKLSWLRFFGTDHEMQIFLSLGICFGMALVTGLTELSSALGAFVGGMIVGSAKETHWVYHSLSSIGTIFMSLFFVSIGMLIDLSFIVKHWEQISVLIIAAYSTNLLINAGILRALGEEWNVSLYGGGLLSQIGEFSFLVSAVGYQMNIINKTAYQMTISVISLTLLLSPLWITLIKHITNIGSTRLRRI